MDESAVKLLAHRFGGGAVARMAAAQALRSQQASAEPSAAAASREASQRLPAAGAEAAADEPSARAAAGSPEAQQALDDEVLLLSSLLNSAAAGSGAAGHLLLAHRPFTAAGATDERESLPSSSSEPELSLLLPRGNPAGSASPPRSSRGSSSQEREAHSSVEQQPAEQPQSSPALGALAAASVAAAPAARPAASPAGAAAHCCSYSGDAADEDTVLTGSPVADSPPSGCASSSGAQPPAGPAAEPPLPLLPGPPASSSEPPCSGSACPSPPPAACPAGQLQQRPASRPASAARQGPPPKQAVRQQLWSFQAIPQGTASIPSKPQPSAGSTAAAAEQPVHGFAPPAGRPAFYVRAASPPPCSPLAVPAAAKPRAVAPEQEAHPPAGAKAAKRRESWQERQERLERLARPRRRAAAVAPQLLPRQPPRSGSRGPGCRGVTGATEAAGYKIMAAPPSAAAQPLGGTRIGAWRPEAQQAPAPAASAKVPTKASLAAQAPAARRGSSGGGGCSGGGGGREQWPQGLGRQPDAEELRRATGAYSEERYRRHLAGLTAMLEHSTQQRRQAADAMAAGVTDFVAAVQGLGTGSGGGGGGSGGGSTAAPAPAAAGLEADQPSLPWASGGEGGACALDDAPPAATADQSVEREQQHAQPVREGAAPTAHPGSLLEGRADCLAGGGEGELAASPTERLLHCRQALQQAGRPATAPCGGGGRLPGDGQPAGEHEQRPASSSPAGVKPLMQVKGEQDLALKALLQRPHPFRAAPLPLSTMEPRYASLAQQAEARRQASHAQRRQQLLAEQRPFGFAEREAERRERRRLARGSPEGSPAEAAGARPAAQAFRAQPVPVSTVEARYALLAAELQLQHRTVKGRGLASPPRRPATAAASAAAPRSPPRRPATACAMPAPAGAAEGAGVAAQAAALQAQHLTGSTALKPQVPAEGWPLPPACSSPCGGRTAAGGTVEERASCPLASPAPPGAVAAAPSAEDVPALASHPTQGAEEMSSYSDSFSACSSTAVAAESPAPALPFVAVPAAGVAGDTSQEAAAPQGSSTAAATDAAAPAAATECASPGSPPALQLAAAGASPRRRPAVGTTHSQQLRAESLQYSLAAGQYDTSAERSRWDTEDRADIELLRQSAMQLPPRPPTVRLGEKLAEAGAVSPSRPAVQRLGCRASSSGGEAAPAAVGGCRGRGGHSGLDSRQAEEDEAGIAVPVHLLPESDRPAGSSGCSAGLAGAELDAGEQREGHSSRGDHTCTGAAVCNGQASASSGGSGQAQQAGAASREGSPCKAPERRRDTPPQHISARHAQAEAAARREVQEALQRRGGGIARLLGDV